MSRPTPDFIQGQKVRLLQDPDHVLTVSAVHWSLFQCWAYDISGPDGFNLQKVFGEFLTRVPSEPSPQ